VIVVGGRFGRLIGNVLNKSEHRYQLARCIFFANQGKFQVGDYE